MIPPMPTTLRIRSLVLPLLCVLLFGTASHAAAARRVPTVDPQEVRAARKAGTKGAERKSEKKSRRPKRSQKGPYVPPTTTTTVERYLGEGEVIRGGRTPRIDTAAQRRVRTAADSLRLADSLAARRSQLLDSLGIPAADTLESRRALDSLLRPKPLPADTLAAADSLPAPPRRRFFSDSMSLSKMCWISTVLPGYGQIYNKQYWKLPILYGVFGTSLGMFIHEGSTYRPLKKQYEAMTDLSLERTPELDELQRRMIRSNTRRQLYLAAAIGSYIYFIGDAAVNYATNEVSAVKKATTLAFICPSAGQIYNKSYWKVPVVLGGFASMAYCIDWNNRGYQRFKKAYRLKSEWDKADPETRPAQSPDEFHGRYSAEFLKNLKDNNRRNRDLCIIATAGIYLLQVVDAHVDAHLKDFDVSDDLAVKMTPTLDYAYIPGRGGRPVSGFKLTFSF